jgi:large subunit ribosomal protein L9
MQKIKSEREKAELMVEKLRGVTCTLHRRAGEQDKLFGSVTTKDIENSLIEQGIEIDRRMIVLEEPVRSLGEFPVKIKLQPGVMAEIKIMVVGEA